MRRGGSSEAVEDGNIVAGRQAEKIRRGGGAIQKSPLNLSSISDSSEVRPLLDHELQS